MGVGSSRQLPGSTVYVVELPPIFNSNAVGNAFRERAEVQFTQPDMYLLTVGPQQAIVSPCRLPDAS